MAISLTAVILAVAVLLIVLRWGATERAGQVAIDYHTFAAFAQRFLDTGSMYLPYQLAGPFDPRPLPHIPDVMPSMYPPHAVYLFAPLLVLPWVLWWVIPLGILGWCLWSWRPKVWAWPVMAAIVAHPETFTPVMVGGSTMWLMAFVAVGLRFGWPAVFITLKPSLAPFALIGIRRRSWWVAAVALGVVSLPLLPEWFAYLAVVRNVETDLTYSLGSLPAMMLPVVAWWARRSGRS